MVEENSGEGELDYKESHVTEPTLNNICRWRIEPIERITLHTSMMRYRNGTVEVFMDRFYRLGQVLLALTLISVTTLAAAADIQGRLAKWHPVQLDFSGPLAAETDNSPNPFLDYRLTVEFTGPSGAVTRVPGFFAGDGQGNGRGTVWRARFSADEVGLWQYKATLRAGTDIAINLDPQAGNSVQLQAASGSFSIDNSPSDASEFLRHGRLEYVGAHYLKFRDGPYWIKGGTDSPENLLGFAGIDGTFDQGGVENNFLHDFAAHRGDWRDGDPLFSHASTGADSRGLIGALNYLGDQGVNSVYFLPMNLGGDGQETYPFVGAQKTRFNKTHYDISKLYQWNQVLNHAQEQGVALNIVLSETEPENEQWLDDGALGVERKLFFRELVARFGYLLAVKWNLGEENDYPRVELDKHSDYLQAIDWSGKPIAVHTHINQFYRYGEIVGDPRYQATSIQYDPQFAGQFVEQWRRNSANTGHPWVIDMDENTDGLAPADVDDRRKQILYDVLFSGGNLEWYFGYSPLPLGGDVTAGDFRQREVMWRQMRYAREMMETHLPFWRMQPDDALVENESDAYGGAEVFALTGEVYAVYLPSANGNESLDLSDATGSFQQRWFDPRSGQWFDGNNALQGSAKRRIGTPPSRQGDDWVVLFTRTGQSSVEQLEPSQAEAPRFLSVPSPDVTVGEQFAITLTASDTDGTFPSVTVGQIPPGMRIRGPGNGQLELSWTVPESAENPSLVELIAIDATDGSLRTTQTMQINITGVAVNVPVVNNDAISAPVFRPVPNLTVQVGQQLSQRVIADDADGVPPSLIVLNAPDGSSLDDNGDGTRSFNWRPGQADVGTRTLTFIARDHDVPGLGDTLNVEVRVTP